MALTADQREEQLGNAPVGGLLLRYSIPSILGLFANGLYNLVDTIFVGQALGAGATAAQAGLWVASPVQMVRFAIAVTIGVGAASVASRCLGEGNRERARATAGTAFTAGACAALLVMALSYAFLTPLLVGCGAGGENLRAAQEYLRIVLLSGVPLTFMVCATQLARAEGCVRTTMIGLLIAGGTNIVLDAIFLFVFDMGIAGVAWATVIAQTCACTWMLIHFRSRRTMLKIGWDTLRIDLGLLRRLMTIGSSSAVRVGGMAVVGIVANRALRTYSPVAADATLYLAIYGLYMRSRRFLVMPLIGILHGLRPIVGFNYGADNPGRVKDSIRVAAISLTCMATLAFLVLMLFPHSLLRCLNSNPEVADVGAPILRIVSMLMPVLGLQVLGAGLFQAIGRAAPAMLLSLSRQMLFTVPLLLILPRYFGVPGIWWSIPIAEALSATVTIFFLVRETRILTRAHEAQQ
jgi:MATE family, multidrug efflux pump